MSFSFQSRHDNCKSLQDQSRQLFYQNTDLGKALFYAIKSQDWKQAFYLMENDAPINRIYQYNSEQYLSTVSLLIKIISEARVKYDHRMLPYKLPYRILELFFTMNVDLKCHCTPKFAHRCPLFIALKNMQIQSEQEIFLPKNELIRKLILNGATIKKYLNDKRTFNIPWFNVEQVRSYLQSQEQLQKEQKKEKNEQQKQICQKQLDHHENLEFNKNVISNIENQEKKDEIEEQKKLETASFNQALQQTAKEYNATFNVNSNGGAITSFKRLKSEFHD